MQIPLLRISHFRVVLVQLLLELIVISDLLLEAGQEKRQKYKNMEIIYIYRVVQMVLYLDIQTVQTDGY